MALRNIVKEGDPVLRMVCKPVEKFDEKLWQLLDDMKETLAKAQGVGLAAPQVGILKRVFIMDVGDGVVECINPVIKKTSGKQRVMEGCLSCPDKWGYGRNGEFSAVRNLLFKGNLDGWAGKLSVPTGNGGGEPAAFGQHS